MKNHKYEWFAKVKGGQTRRIKNVKGDQTRIAKVKGGQTRKVKKIKRGQTRRVQ